MPAPSRIRPPVRLSTNRPMYLRWGRAYWTFRPRSRIRTLPHPRLAVPCHQLRGWTPTEMSRSWPTDLPFWVATQFYGATRFCGVTASCGEAVQQLLETASCGEAVRQSRAAASSGVIPASQEAMLWAGQAFYGVAAAQRSTPPASSGAARDELERHPGLR